MRRTTTWNGLHPRLCLNSSRKHVLRPLHIIMLQKVRNRELFDIRGTPHHCTDPVQPDQSSSRAPTSRYDRCYTPSFLVHATHFIVLRHDVLQLRASDVSSASPLRNLRALLQDELTKRDIFFQPTSINMHIISLKVSSHVCIQEFVYTLHECLYLFTDLTSFACNFGSHLTDT